MRWRFLQQLKAIFGLQLTSTFSFIPGCVRGFGNMPLLRSLSMLLCPLLVTLCLLCLVLLVMPCGKVGVLGSSRASSGRHEISSLPSLTSSLFRSIQIDDVRSWVLSSAPAASVGLGATFSPATWDRVSVVGHLLSALGGATLLGSGITSAGLAVVALPMLLVSLLARFLLASDGLFPLITLTRLRSLRSVAG